MTTEARYKNAIRQIGGAAGLLHLSEEVKQILRETTDLEVKTEMLELIAQDKGGQGCSL